MPKDPLRTRFTEMLGIEFPIIAFTHCKDVAVSVINAGGFAVLGVDVVTHAHISAAQRVGRAEHQLAIVVQ